MYLPLSSERKCKSSRKKAEYIKLKTNNKMDFLEKKFY